MWGCRSVCLWATRMCVCGVMEECGIVKMCFCGVVGVCVYWLQECILGCRSVCVCVVIGVLWGLGMCLCGY